MRHLVAVLALTFGTLLVAAPADAHAQGCGHADLYLWHGTHYDYYDYNGHYNGGPNHYHKWFNATHPKAHEHLCGGPG